MEDTEELNINTTAFVIFLLILNVLGILWTVSCSWMAGRKKRQRVASDANAEELVLQIATSMIRAKGKAANRHSATEQIIILPIDDLGHSLRVPTIVVTPPSPQDTPVEANSLRSDSDSSIGTAEDLIREDPDVSPEPDYSGDFGNKPADGELIRRTYIRDSMRNMLATCPSTDTENSMALQEFYLLTDRTVLSESHTESIDDVEDAAANRESGNNGATCSMDIDSAAVIMINGSHVNNTDNDDSYDDFGFDQNSHRPRLSSIEPGTKKPDLQISTVRRS